MKRFQPELPNESDLTSGRSVGFADGARVCDPQRVGSGAGENFLSALRRGDPLRVTDPRSAAGSPTLRQFYFGLRVHCSGSAELLRKPWDRRRYGEEFSRDGERFSLSPAEGERAGVHTR